MSKPRYAIEIAKKPKQPCIDCRSPTSLVTGTRDGDPICDLCLATQEPRLGSLFALHSSIAELARGFPPRRPQHRRLFELVCDHGRDLAGWFRRGWASALDKETRLAIEVNLDGVRSRARAIGGPAAARCLDDAKWVATVIRRAKAKRVNPHGFLLVAALERGGVLSGAEREDQPTSSVTGFEQPATG